MAKINLNDRVRIKLTPRGRAIQYEDWLRFHQAMPDIFVRYEPPVEVDGWCEMQLWRVMQLFGPHISIGGTPPFEMTFEIPNV